MGQVKICPHPQHSGNNIWGYPCYLWPGKWEMVNYVLIYQIYHVWPEFWNKILFCSAHLCHVILSTQNKIETFKTFKIIWASSWENLSYAIRWTRSLISVFVIHCLDSIVFKLPPPPPTSWLIYNLNPFMSTKLFFPCNGCPIHFISRICFTEIPFFFIPTMLTLIRCRILGPFM